MNIKNNNSKNLRVIVDVNAIETEVYPPQTILNFSISNKGNESIWIVNDNWFSYLNDTTIVLSFAREKLREGAQVFGYFTPDLIELNPLEVHSRTITLKWPLALDHLWNEYDSISPKPGKYKLKVKIGYGNSPNINNEESYAQEEKVLKWQQTVYSKECDLVVPVH